MSKLLDKWKVENKDNNFITTEEEIWQACKTEALRLLKEDTMKPMDKKAKTFEELLEDL